MSEILGVCISIPKADLVTFLTQEAKITLFDPTTGRGTDRIFRQIRVVGESDGGWIEIDGPCFVSFGELAELLDEPGVFISVIRSSDKDDIKKLKAGICEELSKAIGNFIGRVNTNATINRIFAESNRDGGE